MTIDKITITRPNNYKGVKNRKGAGRKKGSKTSEHIIENGKSDLAVKLRIKRHFINTYGIDKKKLDTYIGRYALNLIKEEDVDILHAICKRDQKGIKINIKDIVKEIFSN